MKKLILVLMLTVCGFGVFRAQAQTPPPAAEYKKELRNFMLRSGSMASFDLIIDQVLPLMGGNLTEEQREEIRARAYDSLVDLLLSAYQERISLEDLQAFNRFYQTPAGKRIGAAQPDLLQASMLAGQQWGAQLQQIIQEVIAR